MTKIALCLTFLLSFGAIAKSSSGPILDYNKFLQSKSEDAPNGLPLDIFYSHHIPQFEENPDPQRQVVIEYYQTAIDDSKESEEKIKWFKQLIEEDKKNSGDFSFEARIVGPEGYDLEEDAIFEKLVDEFKPKEISYENVPAGIDFGGAITKKASRDPSSAGGGIARLLGHRYAANSITLVKLSIVSGGNYYVLTKSTDLDPMVVAAVSFMPSIASAGLTYFQGWYGNWVTSGKWTRWLLDSESVIARNLRKGMGLSPATLQNSYDKKRKAMTKKYPELAKKMPEVLETQAMKEARAALGGSGQFLSKARSSLIKAEEYLRWYVAEVIFVGTSIKIPQAIAGLGNLSLNTIGSVAFSSLKGMGAQMLGDLAVQNAKYKAFEQLRDDIKAGKHPNPVKEFKADGSSKMVKRTLLEEVEMVLDRTGAHKAYNVGTASHTALVAIENAARVKGSVFSIACVVGVGLDVATSGGALATWTLGVTAGSGALYYAKVNGVKDIAQKVLPKKAVEYVSKIQKGFTGLYMRPIVDRYCATKFIPKGAN